MTSHCAWCGAVLVEGGYLWIEGAGGPVCASCAVDQGFLDDEDMDE